MDRNVVQRLIPIILILIIVGLAVAALVSLGRTFFGGSSNSPSPTPTVNAGKQALVQTTSDYSVRMTVRGPLVADENYRSYSIVVSPSNRTMTTDKGYGNQQINNSQLANTPASYEQFVYALNRAKLMDGTPLTGDASDTRGICATGSLYTFDVLQGNNVVQSLWTSGCAGSPGSLKANLPQVMNLFTTQIPSYSSLLQNMNSNNS